MLAQFPQRQGKNNAGSRNMDQGFAEVNSLPKRNLNTINGVNSSFNLQHSQHINPNFSLNQTQQIQRNIQNGQIPSYTLKQSQKGFKFSVCCILIFSVNNSYLKKIKSRTS